MAVNDGLMLFQRLLSFLRQLIAPNRELLCQLFFGKVISQSLVQIGRFHLGQASDSFLFENGFFHGRIDVVQRIKSWFDIGIPLIYQNFHMFRRMNPIGVFKVLRKPSLCRKRSKVDPPQENDIPGSKPSWRSSIFLFETGLGSTNQAPKFLSGEI